MTNTTPCSHGYTTGICYDDMTPDARTAYDYTYRHAYNYVLNDYESNRDTAELYAVWYCQTYFVDSLEDGPGHQTGWQKFSKRLDYNSR